MTDETFEGVIVSKEDFTNFDTYNKLSQAQKDFIWIYAKKKLPDLLMQDYDLCLEACVDGGIERMEYEK